MHTYKVVDLFIPCFIDQIYPDVAWSTIKLLEDCGYKVNYNPEQTCCGQPAWNSGLKSTCKPVAEKWVKEYEKAECVVMPSASCAGMVKNYYEEIFNNTSLHVTYHDLKKKTFELSEFLVNQCGRLSFNSKFKGKVVYHHSCAGLRECNIKSEPIELLKNVDGVELLTLKDETVCCGFGGTFSVKHPSIASAMAEQKVNYAIEAGAEYMVSIDSSCLLHMESYAKKKKVDLQFLHIAEVLTFDW